MRYRLALLAVVLQVFALAYMAGEREWILRTGLTILLRTAPIDPNDPMRGDYARLDYDISTVTKEQCRDGALKMFAPNGYVYSRQWRDTRVFATLKINETGVAELDTVSDRVPDSGLYIRGRIESVNDRTLRIRYGIEALFMQQGTAQKLEDTRRHDRPGVPLDTKVALGSSGIAVLKDYQWEPLGITVTFERTPTTREQTGNAAQSQLRQQPRQAITGIVAVLKNYGPEDVAVVDLPDAGSFRLVSDTRWQESRYLWVGESQPTISPKLEAINLIVLKPGQSHPTKIDLTQPQWYVIDTKAKAEQQKPIALRDVTETWAASFRVEYSPLPPASVTTLPHAELIRHGTLRSRAFNPNQGVD